MVRPSYPTMSLCNSEDHIPPTAANWRVSQQQQRWAPRVSPRRLRGVGGFGRVRRLGLGLRRRRGGIRALFVGLPCSTRQIFVKKLGAGNTRMYWIFSFLSLVSMFRLKSGENRYDSWDIAMSHLRKSFSYPADKLYRWWIWGPIPVIWNVQNLVSSQRQKIQSHVITPWLHYKLFIKNVRSILSNLMPIWLGLTKAHWKIRKETFVYICNNKDYY